MQNSTLFRARTVFAPVSLALSLSISALLPSLAMAANPVNSVNNGQIIPGGTFDNTPGDKTTFRNPAGTGLYLKSGSTLVAREVDPINFLPTGNGGNVYIDARGQVVRIDGNMDLRGLRNGGMLTVDAAYYYQNGNILAGGGVNGGTVSLNVSSLTLMPGALIDARGGSGLGGVVTLGNANGAIDIRTGAKVDVSGKLGIGQILNAQGEIVGTYDANLIKIQGGLINMDGILMANGIQTENGGTNGGAIQLIANGGTTPISSSALNDADFMADVKTGLLLRDTFLRFFSDGWIRIGCDGLVQANGGNGGFLGNEISLLSQTDEGDSGEGGSKNLLNGGNGGNILMIAKCGISNKGTIQANGGNGADGVASYGSIIPGGTGDINGLSAKPDKTDLNKVLENKPQYFTVNGQTGQTNNGAAITLSDVKVFSVYLSGGRTAVVFLDMKTGTYLTPVLGKNGGGTVGQVSLDGGMRPAMIFESDSGHETQASVSFSATFANGEMTTVTRDFNVTVTVHKGNRNNPSTADFNFVFLPHPTYAQTIQVARGQDGGDGGNGGKIALLYGNSFFNHGLIQANGGNGGNGGDAFAENPNAIARYAYGGNGGDGGNGGCVFLSGHHYPYGRKNIQTEGGEGGSGGQAHTLGPQEETSILSFNWKKHDDDEHPGDDNKGYPPSANGKNGHDGKDGHVKVSRTEGCNHCGPGGGGSSGPGPSGPGPSGPGGGGPSGPGPSGPGPSGPGGGGASPGSGGSSTTTDDRDNNDQLGLHQDRRPVFFDRSPKQPTVPMLISMGQSRMFLSRTYMPVTQEILNLSLREYNRQLAEGRPAQLAGQEARAFLEHAGINGEVAKNLLERIRDGKLSTAPIVVQVLQDIADSSKTGLLSEKADFPRQ